MRDHVFFRSDDRLEGILEVPPTERLLGGIVVAHPDPLYGGTMAQPLVFHVARACRDRGMAVLRFNFRGVGRSQGEYSGLTEHRDVQAAVSFLRDQLDTREEGSRSTDLHEGPPNRLPLGVVGYSFGSLMSARAVADCGAAVQALALVALVVHWEGRRVAGLEQLGSFGGPLLFVCAERDELVQPAEIESAVAKYRLHYEMTVIRGADHSFRDHKREVGGIVAGFMEEVFQSRRRSDRTSQFAPEDAGSSSAEI